MSYPGDIWSADSFLMVSLSPSWDRLGFGALQLSRKCPSVAVTTMNLGSTGASFIDIRDLIRSTITTAHSDSRGSGVFRWCISSGPPRDGTRQRGPVYVVNDEPGKLTFTLAVDQQGTLFASTEERESDVLERRRYVTRQVQQRLHQRLFRGQVIEAYAERCTICRLRHRELLDAAHILADTDARGQPSISNGLAMCKLHHSAYDRNVLGISPELVVHVRQDVLSESDGPMLIHGLQGFQGGRLYLPRRAEERPNREFLEERYDQFRRAS